MDTLCDMTRETKHERAKQSYGMCKYVNDTLFLVINYIQNVFLLLNYKLNINSSLESLNLKCSYTNKGTALAIQVYFIHKRFRTQRHNEREDKAWR